jgi:hypothetical protein
MTTATASDILAALRRPFRSDEVGWKPAQIAGTRALALPYLNASAIQDRLDLVLGASWEARYDFLEGGAVLCCLRLCIDGQWLERSDVGQCGQGENGTKGGVSDSFKRAARAWGIGRYLTRVAKQWCNYDPQKKRFTEQPRLPEIVRPSQQAEPYDHSDDPPPARIDDRQEAQLVDLLKTAKADIGKFLTYFKVRSVGSLAAADFPAAKRFLEAKIKQGGSTATSPPPNVSTNAVGNGRAKP